MKMYYIIHSARDTGGDTMKNEKTNQEGWWKCSLCGYTVQLAVPPEICPDCHRTCAFTEVTCYTPECGGPGKLDQTIKKGGV
jgi:rubredoxin